ncbi:hypothetical protein RGQ29_020225 [Quercus rubra]|uniref:Uncharacterized protein n=1 Tax=Quercus rubra TaxID=3512 RepID=A0AAN7IWV7_QUERU|nr:hypothetical protein RGQ29_020225 [Quercus rubra]
MANKDQEILDLDLARVSELRLSTETLDIKDYSKRFNESLKLFLQEEDDVKYISDINLGDYENFNPGPRSDDSKETEELKKDEGDEYTANTEDISTNVERLEQDLRGMIAASIVEAFKKEEAGEDFEQKMQTLMRECKERFKNDRDDGKKSLMEYIEECDIEVSDKEFRVLSVIKSHAFKVGINLSRLLVDLVFMMSGKEEFEAKIERFNSALEWICTEDANSIVVKNIVILLDLAKTNVPKKGKWAGLEQTEIDESVQKESSNIRSQIDDLFDQLLKKVLHLLLDQFLELALHLECIMSHPHLPKELNVAQSALECDLEQSKKKLNDIGKDINKLKVISSFKLEHTDVKETRDVMECMIVELWN